MKRRQKWLTNYSLWILGVALIGGAVLRWLFIGQASLWYDEAFSALTADLSLRQISANLALDVHPPGYYLLLSLWMESLGHSETALRSLSAVFSVAAIPLMYGLAHYLFDRPTAAVASLGMAVFPFQVYFAQELRTYSLAIFITTGILWLFFYAVTHPARWVPWLGYALFTAAGLYSHYFVALVVIALHLWLLLYFRRYQAAWLRLIVADVGVTVLFLPQVSRALARTGDFLGAEAWQTVPNLLSPLTTLYYLIFAHRSPVWIAPVGLFLVLLILTFALVDLRRRHADDGRPFEIALWGCVILPIVGVAIISVLAPQSIYVERSFGVSTPALILIMARGFVAAPRLSPTPVLMVALVIPVAITLGAHYVTPDPAKPPVREATQVISAGFEAGDVSLHLQDASCIPALWYADDITHTLVDVAGARLIFAPIQPSELFGGAVQDWDTAIEGKQRLWLTVMPGYIGDPAQQALFERVEATYPRLDSWDWGSVQVYLYDLQGEVP